MMLIPRQANEVIPALFAIFFTTTILGCTMNEDKRNYRPDEVQARVISEESAEASHTYVIFTTLLETQFYSPGVNIKRDKENNIRIEFVRVGFREKAPKTDLKAEYLIKWVNDNNPSQTLREKMLTKSTSAEQIFEIPGDVGSIYITDGGSEKKIWEK